MEKTRTLMSHRYEAGKSREWKVFLKYLKSRDPPLNPSQCGGAEVVEFLKHLHHSGRTKVHTSGCQYFGTEAKQCQCPMRQSAGSLAVISSRLKAAYAEIGRGRSGGSGGDGEKEKNPFGESVVRYFLSEMRQEQKKARGRRPVRTKVVVPVATTRSVPTAHSSIIKMKNLSNITCLEPHNVSKKLRKRRRVIDDDIEDIEAVNIKSSQAVSGDLSNVSETSCYIHTQPVLDPIWRGSFKICNNNLCTIDELVAHLSNKACLEAFKVAKLLPEVLNLEILPWLDVWPISYDQSLPTEKNIALYFFQGNKRCDNTLDVLLDDIISKDLAMKAVLGNMEFFIFTSLKLPLQHRRFQGKRYLWGELRGIKLSSLGQPRGHLFSQNSNNDVGTGEERNPTKNQLLCSPLHSPSDNGVDNEKQRIESMNNKEFTQKKISMHWYLGPQSKRMRSKVRRSNPSMYNYKIVSASGSKTGASVQEPDKTELLSSAQEADAEQPPIEKTVNKELIEKGTLRITTDCSTEIGHPVDSILGEEYAEEERVARQKEPEGINDKESEMEIPLDTAVQASTRQGAMSVGSGNDITNSVVPILQQEITNAIDQTFMIQKADQLNLVALSKDLPEGPKTLAGTSEGPQVVSVSGPDVQETIIASQCQEVILNTIMLEKTLEKEGRGCPNGLVSPSISLSLANMENIFDEFDLDETASADNSLAQVGTYIVKSKLAPILRAIINKYGDIAHDCSFPSNSTRSSFLEELCKAVQHLQQIPFSNFKGNHLNLLDSVIMNAEFVNLKVDWLRCRYDELKETVCSLKCYKNVKVALVKSSEVVESTKSTLDSKEVAMMKLNSELHSLESESMSLAADIKNLDSAINDARSKYEQFNCKPLVDGLL